MDKAKLIGLRIKTMRLSRKMTQADLANLLGQSASSITMYETGRRSPDYETLEALADIFNVSLSSIIANDPENDPLLSDPQIRIVSSMMENMTKEEKDQIIAIVRAVVTHQSH